MSSLASTSGFFPPTTTDFSSFEDVELNDHSAPAAPKTKVEDDDTEWVIIRGYEDESSSAAAPEDKDKDKAKANQWPLPTATEKKTWLKYLGRAIEKVAEEMVDMIEREKVEWAYEDERELERALEEKEREKEALQRAMEFLGEGADE